MGCDIHMVIEREVEPGRWLLLRTFDGFRTGRSSPHGLDYAVPVARMENYARFAALAGVRGDGPAPRGLPDDVCPSTAHIVERDSGHSHSWLPLPDATAIFFRTQSWHQDLTGFDRNHPNYFFWGLEEDELAEFNHRLVFWFDS